LLTYHGQFAHDGVDVHDGVDTLLQQTCSLMLEGSAFRGGEQHGEIVAGGR